VGINKGGATVERPWSESSEGPKPNPSHRWGARCSSHGCPAVFRGSQQVPQRRTGTLCFQGCRDLTSTWHPSGGLGPSDDSLHGLSSTHTSRSTRPSLEQRPVRCWPAGAPAWDRREHPPRAILAAHEVKHLDHLVSRSSYRVKLLLQLPKRVPQPRRSRPGWPWAAWIASADKAHKVHGDGGAEACSSTPHAAGISTLTRPPAAAGGLRSQVPDLVHGPRELLDCRQLQQAGRRDRTRFFDRRSRAGIDLAASAIIPGRQSLN